MSTSSPVDQRRTISATCLGGLSLKDFTSRVDWSGARVADSADCIPWVFLESGAQPLQPSAPAPVPQETPDVTQVDAVKPIDACETQPTVSDSTQTTEQQNTLVESQGSASTSESEVAAIEAERELALKKAAEEQAAAEKLAAERALTEKAEAERAAAQHAEAEKIAAEKIAAEKIAAEKIAAEEKAVTEKAAAEKIAAEHAANEKLAAEKAATEKAAAEKKAAEHAAAEKRVAEETAAAEEKQAALRAAEAARAAEEQASIRKAATKSEPTEVVPKAPRVSVEQPRTGPVESLPTKVSPLPVSESQLRPTQRLRSDGQESDYLRDLESLVLELHVDLARMTSGEGTVNENQSQWLARRVLDLSVENMRLRRQLAQSMKS